MWSIEWLWAQCYTLFAPFIIITSCNELPGGKKISGKKSYQSKLYLIYSYSIDWLIDWLINCFMSRSRIFHLYGDVTITGEGLQNLGLCSVLRAFEQGVISIMPHLLWHGASVFPVSFSHFLRHPRGYGKSSRTKFYEKYGKIISL
jgi:hypothetical protein